MTPEQRLNRLERVAKLFVRAGMRAREQSREQNERINILIQMHEKDREVRQVESQELNEKINILVNSQIEMTGSQKETNAAVKDLAAAQSETDKSLRAFLDSLRKGGNGNSSS